MVHAIKLTESQTRRAVPIHGIGMELFEAQMGSSDLAWKMRKQGWIFPVCEKPLLFDTGDSAFCWSRILNGEHPDTHPGGGVKRGAALLDGKKKAGSR